MHTSPQEDERRSRLLNALPAIAWSASAQTFRFTYVNPAAEKLLGYPASSWLDEPDFWVQRLHPGDRHVARFCHSETLACRDHEIVYRMIAADGRTVWLRDYINVHVVDGVPVELFGVMVDITREREAEEASLENQENFRRMVELSPDCIGVHIDGTYVYVNQAFVQLVGAKHEEEVVGRTALSFVDPASQELAMARLARLKAGESVPYERLKLLRIDGSPLDVEVAALPLHFGHREAVQVIARDITARVRDEQERIRARQALEEARRMSSLGQVAASLAHEFNNVLMGIQPFVDVIARNADSSRPITNAIGHITRSIARGKRASQEILRFANPKEPQLFPIDVRTWLPTLFAQLVGTLPPSIALSSSMDPDVSFVRGDPEYLEQVITNLIFNARDAMADRGQIHINVSGASNGASEERVCVSVSDDGPGINPSMLDQIFEPLYTTKRSGTGLGLAIARRLMEQQDGTLTAENRPAGGAIFRLLVPASESAPPVVLLVPGAIVGVTRILLVEDDLAVGTGMEELLNLEGYETTWVRAGADACEAARRTQPHVAIIDVNLPDGNGVDLIAVLRAQQADLPVVLSTGHLELDRFPDQNRILSLMKPYEISDLLTAIGTVTAAA